MDKKVMKLQNIVLKRKIKYYKKLIN